MDTKRVKNELFEHLPFTAFGVCLSIALVAIIQSFMSGTKDEVHHQMENFFYIFHALHIFLSALTSTAISLKVGRNIMRAAMISAFTTVPFCVLSDVLMPFLGSFLFKMPVEFHMSATEEPAIVFSFLVFGILSGIISERKIGKVSYFSHGTHVLLSSFATLFYIVGYGADNWIRMLGQVFVITFLSDIIPCCMSDIIFPVAFTHAEHEHPHT